MRADRIATATEAEFARLEARVAELEKVHDVAIQLGMLADDMERVLALTEPLYLRQEPAERKASGLVDARRIVTNASAVLARLGENLGRA